MLLRVSRWRRRRRGRSRRRLRRRRGCAPASGGGWPARTTWTVTGWQHMPRSCQAAISGSATTSRPRRVLRLEVGGEPAAAVRRAGLVEGLRRGRGTSRRRRSPCAPCATCSGAASFSIRLTAWAVSTAATSGSSGSSSSEPLGGRALALVDQRGEERLLAVEVDVERALRHLRLAGDLAHAGGIEALGRRRRGARRRGSACAWRSRERRPPAPAFVESGSHRLPSCSPPSAAGRRAAEF